MINHHPDYIGVDNLTEQQYRAFSSKEKLLWINGTAGASKSVILCGKIREVIQSNDENKVVLFKCESLEVSQLQLYQDAFDKATIKYAVCADSTSELITLIADRTTYNYQVLIIERLAKTDDRTKIPMLIKEMGR